MEEKVLHYQKLQFVFSLMSMIFLGLLTLIVAIVVMNIMPKVEQLYSSAMVSLENLEETSRQLNDLDLPELVENVNELTVEASSGVAAAVGKLDDIDVENLNRSIKSLAAIIEPLAKFFGG